MSQLWSIVLVVSVIAIALLAIAWNMRDERGRFTFVSNRESDPSASVYTDWTVQGRFNVSFQKTKNPALPYLLNAYRPSGMPPVYPMPADGNILPGVHNDGIYVKPERRSSDVHVVLYNNTRMPFLVATLIPAECVKNNTDKTKFRKLHDSQSEDEGYLLIAPSDEEEPLVVLLGENCSYRYVFPNPLTTNWKVVVTLTSLQNRLPVGDSVIPTLGLFGTDCTKESVLVAQRKTDGPASEHVECTNKVLQFILPSPEELYDSVGTETAEELAIKWKNNYTKEYGNADAPEQLRVQLCGYAYRLILKFLEETGFEKKVLLQDSAVRLLIERASKDFLYLLINEHVGSTDIHSITFKTNELEQAITKPT